MSGPPVDRRLFTFPHPVDEVSARLVATGVVAMAVAWLVTGWTPLLWLLAYGFLARVAAGPPLSPLGLLVTRVVRPRLSVTARPVPGPPKRFAQAIGAGCSLSALIAVAVLDAPGVAVGVIVVLVAAASLEAFAGFCVGCAVFAGLMRVGVVPSSVCEACDDLWGTGRS